MTRAEDRSRNYEFYISADLSGYEGKWIAIVDGRIVASGDDAGAVYREAKKKYPDSIIAIDMVPTEDVLVF